MKYNNIMFFKFMFLVSFFLSLSSNSMFLIWMSLEINMMMFITMKKKITSTLSNSMMKYFIFQSLASSLFIYCLMMLFSTINYSNLIYNLIPILMLMKMGMFPFNSWYFQISENLNWNMWFLLNTSQKIMPLWILSINNMNSSLLMVMLIMNIIYSTSEMWNQTSIRWMINSSSLNHFSWMMICLNNYKSIWEYYFMIYVTLSYILYKLMYMNNWNSIYTSFNNKNINMNFLMSIVLFNFMGLPPFLGFLPKLMILKMNFNIWILMLLIFNNIFMSIIYFNFIINMTKMSMMKMLKNHKYSYFNFHILMINLMFNYVFMY